MESTNEARTGSNLYQLLSTLKYTQTWLETELLDQTMRWVYEVTQFAHAIALEAAEAGVPLERIGSALGHHSIDETWLYLYEPHAGFDGFLSSWGVLSDDELTKPPLDALLTEADMRLKVPPTHPWCDPQLQEKLTSAIGKVVLAVEEAVRVLVFRPS